MQENLSSGVCEQHRRRPACASAQIDQGHCPSLIGKYHVSLLVSVAEEAGLKLALSETRKTGFLATRPILLANLRVPI